MSRPPAGRTRRRILITLAVLVLLSPAAFIVTYRIVAKKLLSGPRLRAEINQKPEALLIDWDEAVSTWPGRVNVKNLRIRGSDSNVQWIVILPEASLKYSLSPLLKRTFVVRELRPKSLEFRLRQKLPPGQASEARVRVLPPIPGFGDPPLRIEEAAPTPPASDPFTIEVQDVATDAFNDIWVDGFHYRGPAKLRGRFRLKPGHRAQIGPASVELEGGELGVGDKPGVKELSGKLEATFAAWDVQALQGDKVWQVVTAKIDLAGPTDGVDFIDGVLQLGPGVHVSGGPGRFGVSGAIDRGTASARVELTAKQAKYARPGLTLVGDPEAHVTVANLVLDGGSAEVDGSALKVSNVFVSGAARGTKPWRGEFKIRKGKLAKGKGLTASVEVNCSDGRPLLAFLGEALPAWTKGLIDLEGLTATAEVVLSEPRTAVHGLEASGGKFTVQGEYDRRGERANGAFLIETGMLIVGVELDNGKAILRPILGRQWFAKVRPGFSESSKSGGAEKPKNGTKPEN